MGHPLIYTVMVNWNRWEDTRACLASVLAMDYPNLNIVVVDNGSAPVQGANLPADDLQVEIISSPVNLGFAGGINLAIERSLLHGADYILALNNDMIVDRLCLSRLVAWAEQNPETGMVGPKIYYLNPPDRIWFAGAHRNPWSLSLQIYGKGQQDKPELNHPRRVDYLCAGAVLVRAEVFRQVGLFDPLYFMYYEDCDLCIRVGQAGYQLWYLPSARVWHQVAASTGGEGSPMELYYRTVSVFRFLRQHARGLHKYVLIALRTGYVGLKIAQRRLAGQPEAAQWLWKGLKEGLSGRPGRPG